MPSSQASSLATIPSPQVEVQTDGSPGQTKPCSTVQAAEQPSLLTTLRSSQPSVGPTVPSPQTSASVVEVLVEVEVDVVDSVVDVVDSVVDVVDSVVDVVDSVVDVVGSSVDVVVSVDEVVVSVDEVVVSVVDVVVSVVVVVDVPARTGAARRQIPATSERSRGRARIIGRGVRSP